MNALEICIVTFGIVAIFVKLAVSCLLWTDMIWDIRFTPRRKKNDPKDPCAGAKLPSLETVRDLINKATANCLRAGGETHEKMALDTKNAMSEASSGRRTANLALTMALDQRLAWIVATGFNGREGDVGYHYFEMKGRFFKCAESVSGHTIPIWEQAPAVEITKKEFDSAWAEFDGFWQSNGSYGICFCFKAICPNGINQDDQETGVTIRTPHKDVIEAFKRCPGVSRMDIGGVEYKFDFVGNRTYCVEKPSEFGYFAYIRL